MKMINAIKGDLIKSMSTKFNYVNDQLSFQIVLNYDNNLHLVSESFNNFSDYQDQHNLLIDTMNNQRDLKMQFSIA